VYEEMIEGFFGLSEAKRKLSLLSNSHQEAVASD